ncbi:IS91 family transposase, partial [Escherichia coli]
SFPFQLRFLFASRPEIMGWVLGIVYRVIATHLVKKAGTVAKLAMRQPFVLFKGLTFQKLCLPGAFRPGDHHNK